MRRILTMTFFLSFSGVLLHAQTLTVPAREYTIDVPASRVEFFVASSAGDVNGTFESWKGELEMSTPGVSESATLNLKISARSMTTGSRVKDKMVKGKVFFYVKKYPTVTFVSTKVIPSGNPNKFQVQGDFTLRGITKPVTLQVTLERDSNGGVRIYADMSFDRREFWMTKNVPFVRVSDSVRVRLDLYVMAKTIGNAGKIVSPGTPSAILN